MSFNKIFAAVLIAGITAMLAGFVAKTVVQAEKPEENAYKIEVVEDAGAGGAAGPTGPEPILALLATADVAKGEGIAKACAACHSFGKGEAARVGPNLYGIVGNHHAHMEGFAYSDAMAALKDKTWDYHELNEFIYNPKKHIPGTKMVFAGLKKPEQRAAVIAYLRTLSDSPVALPSDAEIAAETPAEGTGDAATPAAEGEGKTATPDEAKPSKEKGDAVKAKGEQQKNPQAQRGEVKQGDKKPSPTPAAEPTKPEALRQDEDNTKAEDAQQEKAPAPAPAPAQP